MFFLNFRSTYVKLYIDTVNTEYLTSIQGIVSPPLGDIHFFVCAECYLFVYSKLLYMLNYSLVNINVIIKYPGMFAIIMKKSSAKWRINDELI